VGTNRISFARARTDGGIEYRIDGKESGWRFVLREKSVPGARYSLNGKPISPDSTGVTMTERQNRLLISHE
jgi:hypothetical protein